MPVPHSVHPTNMRTPTPIEMSALPRILRNFIVRTSLFRSFSVGEPASAFSYRRAGARTARYTEEISHTVLSGGRTAPASDCRIERAARKGVEPGRHPRHPLLLSGICQKV